MMNPLSRNDFDPDALLPSKSNGSGGNDNGKSGIGPNPAEEQRMISDLDLSELPPPPPPQPQPPEVEGEPSVAEGGGGGAAPVGQLERDSSLTGGRLDEVDQLYNGSNARRSTLMDEDGQQSPSGRSRKSSTTGSGRKRSRFSSMGRKNSSLSEAAQKEAAVNPGDDWEVHGPGPGSGPGLGHRQKSTFSTYSAVSSSLSEGGGGNGGGGSDGHEGSVGTLRSEAQSATSGRSEGNSTIGASSVWSLDNQGGIGASIVKRGRSSGSLVSASDMTVHHNNLSLRQMGGSMGGSLGTKQSSSLSASTGVLSRTSGRKSSTRGNASGSGSGRFGSGRFSGMLRRRSSSGRDKDATATDTGATAAHDDQIALSMSRGGEFDALFAYEKGDSSTSLRPSHSTMYYLLKYLRSDFFLGLCRAATVTACLLLSSGATLGCRFVTVTVGFEPQNVRIKGDGADLGLWSFGADALADSLDVSADTCLSYPPDFDAAYISTDRTWKLARFAGVTGMILTFPAFVSSWTTAVGLVRVRPGRAGIRWYATLQVLLASALLLEMCKFVFLKVRLCEEAVWRTAAEAKEETESRRARAMADERWQKRRANELTNDETTDEAAGDDRFGDDSTIITHSDADGGAAATNGTAVLTDAGALDGADLLNGTDVLEGPEILNATDAFENTTTALNGTDALNGTNLTEVNDGNATIPASAAAASDSALQRAQSCTLSRDGRMSAAASALYFVLLVLLCGRRRHLRAEKRQRSAHLDLYGGGGTRSRRKSDEESSSVATPGLYRDGPGSMPDLLAEQRAAEEEEDRKLDEALELLSASRDLDYRHRSGDLDFEGGDFAASRTDRDDSLLDDYMNDDNDSDDAEDDPYAGAVAEKRGGEGRNEEEEKREIEDDGKAFYDDVDDSELWT